MKTLALILLLIPAISFSQSKKVAKNLKTADLYVGSFSLAGENTQCALTSVNYFVSNHNVFIDMWDTQYDLTVYKRSKDKSILYAKDSEGNLYTLIGMKIDDNWGIMITSPEKTYVISAANICEK